jgi:dipeptidyl aminopeptidase/acylaminoacyl peptidase
VLALAAMSAGCAVTQPQNTPVQERHEVDSATGRGFWLYVPSGYRGDHPAPLIVTCHGTWPYDVANDHIREWKWYAEQNGCIVIAPELGATDGLFGSGPVSGMLSDEKFILSIVSGLGYRLNIDRSNVMITGFSGGGFPTYWVGLRHPDVFTVVVARSCNFNETNSDGWWTPESLRTPIKIYYGEKDFGAIKGQSDLAIQYFRSKGFAVDVEVMPGIGHERHPEVAMDFFRRHWKAPHPSLAVKNP